MRPWPTPVALLLLLVPLLPASAWGDQQGHTGDARATPAAEGSGAAVPDTVVTGDVRRVTLQEAVRTALARNPVLHRARTSLSRARYDRLNAYGDFLPTLRLGYGFSNASTARLDPTQQSLTRTSYTLQLGGSFEILDGLRRFSRLESARRQVDAARSGLRQQRYETILRVKEAYYDAVARRELVRVEQDRVRRQKDQLELARQQLELGRATRSDLLRSRVDLNNARLALLRAENDARAATFSLAEAMGVEERVAPVKRATLETEPLEPTRAELQRMAMTASPRVQSARSEARAAEAEVGAARSSYLPTLTFQGGWAWQASDYPPENRSWSLSLTGSYPLFDGFQRENALYQAQARAEAAEARRREAELSARATVDDAYSQVQSARAAVDLAQQSVDLSREDLRLTRERYRLGLATILDLQSAQINLAQAQADLVQRRLEYQLGVARLESLLGRSLRHDTAMGGTP